MTTRDSVLETVPRDLAVAAEDGFQLGATLFESSATADVGEPLVIIGPAAAVPSRYYASFAGYLAERGRTVLTFDYRGIGKSRPPSLAGFDVRMRDWCILDVPGVLNWVSQRYPDRTIHWVGHSLGGFATGLAHNNQRIARQLNIATLSGYWRGMAAPERYRVLILMGFVAPLLVRALGYFPGRLMGGEDMPASAFLEWARWCRTPDFIFGDPTLTETRHFNHFTAPVRFAQIADDPWGTPTAVANMARHFTASAERSFWTIVPSDVAARKIGHLGFFRPEFRDKLWPAAEAWLTSASTSA